MMSAGPGLILNGVIITALIILIAHPASTMEERCESSLASVQSDTPSYSILGVTCWLIGIPQGLFITWIVIIGIMMFKRGK